MEEVHRHLNKMNRKYIIVALALFLVVTVTAGIIGTSITRNDRDLRLTPEEKSNLTRVNLTSYETNDYEKDDLTQRCLYKRDAIDLCSDYMNETSLDKWEERIMKEIAEATSIRALENEKTKVRNGTTTITDREVTR